MTRVNRTGLAAALVALPCLTASAQVARPPDSVEEQLTQVLSLITGGMLSAATAPPQVVKAGDGFNVRIPLNGLAAPVNAAMQAVLRPAGGGLWTLVSLTVPPAGRIDLPLAPAADPGKPGGVTGSVTYTIREQAVHGRIDLTLTAPSPYAGVLSGIEIQADLDGVDMRQTLDRYSTDGILTGEPDNRVTLRSQTAFLNWHLNLENRASEPTTVRVKSMAINYAVEGLDRDKATQLRSVFGQVSGPPQAAPGSVEAGVGRPSVAGAPPSGTRPLAQSAPLEAIMTLAPGLLRGISEQAALEGVHFDHAGSGGDIGALRLSVDGAADGDRVSGTWDLTISGLTVSSVPDLYVHYVPSRIGLRFSASGLRSNGLRQLMLDYTGAQPDMTVLRQEIVALLADRDTHVGIEAFSADIAPLHVEGSSHIVASPDGTAGVDIHLVATGVDAMVARVQSDPSLQQILPMVFLAKGMGRAEGNALVWDMAYADGSVTVNGLPLGGPAAGPQAGQLPSP